jgi:hypothetical protein
MPSVSILIFVPGPGCSCACDEPMVCCCSSTSGFRPPDAFTTSMTSLNLLHDIFLGHHSTCSRISIMQCRRILLHHIATGACVDYVVDASVSPRPDHSAFRALSHDVESAAEMSNTVSNIFLEVDHKQMLTENLSHLAAALNISVPGIHNIRFKLRAAIRKHADTISAATTSMCSSASVADFFNSFESPSF